MGEDGHAVGAAAHHRVPCVHMAGPSEGVELHCQNIGVRTTSVAPLATLMAVWYVHGRKGEKGGRDKRVRIERVRNKDRLPVNL